METSIFGWAAGACGVVYNFPQIVHIWREKTGAGISGIALGIRSMSYVLYIVHGFNVRDSSLVIMTVVALAQVCVIAAQRRYYMRTPVSSPRPIDEAH